MTDTPRPSDPDAASVRRLSAWVHGHVQGVGFRWHTRACALERGLVGHATNKRDGRVHVVAEGTEDACHELLAWLRSGATPGRVDLVVVDSGPEGTEGLAAARGGYRGFEER